MSEKGCTTLYHATLLVAEALIDIDPPMGTPEFNYLTILVKGIEAYEKEKFPIGGNDEQNKEG